MNCDPRRKQILDAALRRFDHYGYRKTTMAEIAREAGVSVGALYLFFKSKEEILLANAELRYCQYMAAMREVLSRPLSPPDKLEEVGRVRVLHLNRLCTSSPHAGDLVRLLREKFHDHHRGLLQQEVRILEEVLREGVDAGVFDVEDIPSAASCIHAAYIAYLPPQSEGLTEAQLTWAAGQMARLLLHGIKRRRGLCE
jgi:AcrR family transcriptional regulator